MVDGRWDAEFRASARDIAVQRINLRALAAVHVLRSEEHTSELQSQSNLVCRLLLEKKNSNLCGEGAVSDRNLSAQRLTRVKYVARLSTAHRRPAVNTAPATFAILRLRACSTAGVLA